MTATRGDVRWAPALHKSGSAYRPWLVVSDDTHPFADEECLVVALTTTDHPDGLPVRGDAWVDGGSEVASYASPWYVTTVKTATFDRYQGRLDPALVSRVATHVHDYVPD